MDRQKTQQVKEINHGIASRHGQVIFINRRLKDYPKLFKAILKHEKAHSNGFTWNDIEIDLKGSHLTGLKHEYWGFVKNNPSSWTEFLPCSFYEGKLVINPLIMMFYSIIIILIGVIGWIWI